MSSAIACSRRPARRDSHNNNVTRSDSKDGGAAESYPVSYLPERPAPCVLPTRVDKSDILSLSRTAVEIAGVIELAVFPCSIFAVEPNAVVDNLDDIAYSFEKSQWILGYPSPKLPPARRARSMATFLNNLTRFCRLAYTRQNISNPTTPRQWITTKSARITSDGDVDEVSGLALVEAGVEAS